MISLTPILNDALPIPLYMQLYQYIRDAVLAGHIPPGEKLPSLRALSKSLALSLSTIASAYNQLSVEGYITSHPQSGYYVNSIPSDSSRAGFVRNEVPFSPYFPREEALQGHLIPSSQTSLATPYYDPACFDFTKWKKCVNRVFNYNSHALFLEGNPRGEEALRREISKYVYQARGVLCTADQIVIGAGTQQLINLLCIILHRLDIDHVSFEDPGYQPVQSIFKDRDFKMTNVPVDKDGIQIERLPVNIRSTVYVSPSNQFPTGSVMPIGRRYALLDWAARNDSIIIEDDYNSELRYFSRPVPSLQGLDKSGRVVYLGSFSSTLFPSVKISYMVLPTAAMGRLFEEALGDYTQTCSKAEQLTLALYMEQGFYQTDLKKLRKLYGYKIQLATQAIEGCHPSPFRIRGSASGLHMMLEVRQRNADAKCAAARAAGLPVHAVPQGRHEQAPASNQPQAQLQSRSSDGFESSILFYYTRIPADKMEDAIKTLTSFFQ